MEIFRTPQLELTHSILEWAKNFNKHQENILKEFNISHEQLNILITLHYDSRESSLSLLEIQNQMVLQTTNMSRLIDKLKAKKLVTRKINKQNRRKVDIKITKEGEILTVNAIKKVKFYTEKLNIAITDKEALDLRKKIEDINDLILDWD